jgi:hypothetical protein
MKPFLTTKRKMLELLFLVAGVVILMFAHPGVDSALLFSLGFLWNWTASQELRYVFENHRYKFSLVKMVYTLQYAFVWPFRTLPEIFKLIPRGLPAGLFWGLVVWFVQAQMPWWATFAGSVAFELTQVQRYLPPKKTL